MIGLLCLGKSAYADVEAFRQGESLRRALGFKKLPSEETLRQRMAPERLPSGEFATKALVLSLGLVAYNLLRLCGQTALAENETPPPET